MIIKFNILDYRVWRGLGWGIARHVARVGSTVVGRRLVVRSQSCGIFKKTTKKIKKTYIKPDNHSPPCHPPPR
ncbi:hypothetical protein HanIR_Chr02g0093031 [Helianthus annuus]|nr:hypothetical protein HanIR_Chr02g0093031 [Helianthus annuus]